MEDTIHAKQTSTAWQTPVWCIAWILAVGIATGGWLQACVARAEVRRLTSFVAERARDDAASAGPSRARGDAQPTGAAAMGLSGFGEAGAIVDEGSRADAELVIASLRRDGAKGLARLPQASPADLAGSPSRVRGKIVPVTGRLREVRHGSGFSVGRIATAQGAEVYFATPLALEGLTLGSECVFHGLPISLQWPSQGRSEDLVVGAFMTK
jgi:hypothetical protein